MARPKIRSRPDAEQARILLSIVIADLSDARSNFKAAGWRAAAEAMRKLQERAERWKQALIKELANGAS